MATTKKLMGTTAVGGGALAIEDVFSTYLYTGNGTANTITNGIDLAGEGGLVWAKWRSVNYATNSHQLFDTERGVGNHLSTDTTDGQLSLNGGLRLTSFNSDGYTIGNTAAAAVNTSGSLYASWTWRKAPRFFDCVTWTGDNVQGRAISHNLGDVPGCIVVKITSGASDNWVVYHRSVGAGKFLKLNATDSQLSSVAVFPTNPTDSVFYVGNDSAVNWSGGTYVAYLFAHDPLGPSGDGSDGLIACGSYTVSGGAASIDLGWEPQFVINKIANDVGAWFMFDNMRGMAVNGVDAYLRPDSSNAENSGSDFIDPTPTGFNIKNLGGSQTFIYIAIRRGPMRQPTSGTEVFAVDTTATAASGSTPSYVSNFPVDMGLYRRRSTTASWALGTRLLQGTGLNPSSTAAEYIDGEEQFDYMIGWKEQASAISDQAGWMFRRAPGFFDVVAYTGTGVVRTVPHNLGVAPEMMIVKVRNATNSWMVYHKDLSSGHALYLNYTFASSLQTTTFNATDPSSDVFTLGPASSTNSSSGYNYIAYLFASCPGVSKVGSYTGNGSSQTINCGFTSGARFVLIKRTDSTGDWYVWDTARGIVAANDPHLSLNTTAAEVTTDDSVDPDNSGFIVNQVAATNINVSSASYIYLAVS